MSKKITIIIDDEQPETNDNCWREPKPIDNGWIGGKNICATCPNRPGGPNNKRGYCHCAIPSLYGPNRVTMG